MARLISGGAQRLFATPRRLQRRCFTTSTYLLPTFHHSDVREFVGTFANFNDRPRNTLKIFILTFGIGVAVCGPEVITNAGSDVDSAPGTATTGR